VREAAAQGVGGGEGERGGGLGFEVGGDVLYRAPYPILTVRLSNYDSQ
jgi:hypothetical protein